MSENVPPNSAPAASASTSAPDAGRPYYEDLRDKLRKSIAQKRQLDQKLAELEENIFKVEGQYLEDTASSGNIVRGFDGWVKGVQIGRGGVEDRRKGRARDDDRVFSRSSVSWMRAQEGPDSNMPSVAPTPTGNFPPQLATRESNASTPAASSGKLAGNKKKRPTEKDDEDEKPAKRNKISYSRD